MRSFISGVQIPSLGRLNIDGQLTLSSSSGTSGQALISQGSSVPIWSNLYLGTTAVSSSSGAVGTLAGINAITSPTSVGSGTLFADITSGTVNVGTGVTSGTINIGSFATTTTGRTININTGATGSIGVTTNIGSNVVGGTINLYSGLGYINLIGSGTIKTQDITGGNSINLYLTTGSTTTSGNSGNSYLDVGTAAGTAGTVNIGTSNASAINIGRATSGTLNLYNPLLASISTIGGGGAEGGQINFARVTDGAQYWYIDSFGTTSTPNLRFIENATSRFEIIGGTGAFSVNGQVGVSGQVLTSGGSSAPTWTTPHIFHTPAADYVVATTTTANATMTGPAFAKTATLSASTTYFFECLLLVKTIIGSGTGTGNFTLTWGTGGGGGPSGNLEIIYTGALAAGTTSTTTNNNILVSGFSSLTLNGTVSGTQYQRVIIQGIVRTGSIPAYNIYPILSAVNSATPGITSSITTLVGSYIQYTPLTASGSDVSIGTWV